MMYLHFCSDCIRIHLLNGHKTACPKCEKPLTELSISYMNYINMDISERNTLLEKCTDKTQLAQISTVYRMHKYSKSYKNMPSDTES